MPPSKGVPGTVAGVALSGRNVTSARWGFDMRRLKGVLLSTAASLAGIAAGLGAQAADLPARQAAPIEYVRICDAYGAGFFFIPGTDTCLRTGGLVPGEARGFDPSFNIAGTNSYAKTASTRDAARFNALGRAELDARTPSPFGSLGSLGTTINSTAGSTVQRQTTNVNKAFIQFAGLTAGLAQSMFDFHAGAYNGISLRGSNASVAPTADPAPSLSAENQADRRGAIGSTIAGTATAAGDTVPVTGARSPDVAGTIHLDQPGGAAQLTAAPHQNNTTLFGSTALAAPPASFAIPAAASGNYGLALQGGIQLNADYLSPGDKLWLEAAYDKGTFGYLASNNLALNYGAVNQNRYAGSGFASPDFGSGWSPQPNADCVFATSAPGVATGSVSCQQQWGWDITGASKHYWIPALSPAVYGSYMEGHYPGDALAGSGGALGVSNIKEGWTGSNLVWPPLKGFDIGAEFMYVHLNQTRPAGLASDAVLNAAGLPSFEANTNQYEGRLRIQRAF